MAGGPNTRIRDKADKTPDPVLIAELTIKAVEKFKLEKLRSLQKSPPTLDQRTQKTLASLHRNPQNLFLHFHEFKILTTELWLEKLIHQAPNLAFSAQEIALIEEAMRDFVNDTSLFNASKEASQFIKDHQSGPLEPWFGTKYEVDLDTKLPVAKTISAKSFTELSPELKRNILEHATEESKEALFQSINPALDSAAESAILIGLPENFAQNRAIQDLIFYARLLEILKSTEDKVHGGWFAGTSVPGFGHKRFPRHAAELLKAIQSGQYQTPKALCEAYAEKFANPPEPLFGRRDEQVRTAYKKINALMTNYLEAQNVVVADPTEGAGHVSALEDTAVQIEPSSRAQSPESSPSRADSPISLHSNNELRDSPGHAERLVETRRAAAAATAFAPGSPAFHSDSSTDSVLADFIAKQAKQLFIKIVINARVCDKTEEAALLFAKTQDSDKSEEYYKGYLGTQNPTQQHPA